jgi:predicted transcriptional regulator
MSRVLAEPALLDAPVRRVMDEPFPTVRPSAPMSEALAPLARRRAAVLVMDNGHPAGLLTRLDFLKFIHA